MPLTLKLAARDYPISRGMAMDGKLPVLPRMIQKRGSDYFDMDENNKFVVPINDPKLLDKLRTMKTVTYDELPVLPPKEPDYISVALARRILAGEQLPVELASEVLLCIGRAGLDTDEMSALVGFEEGRGLDTQDAEDAIE